MGFSVFKLGASAPLRTQISGKYSPDNTGVFALKRQLVEAGLEVKFPVGDAIIEYILGFAVTVPHEIEVPFHTTEVKFFREIKRNDLQITYDVHCENDGYVGESTAIETAYALLCNKPIIMLRPPTNYSATLAQSIQEIIERYKGVMITASVDQMPVDQLRGFLHQVAALRVDYNLTNAEQETIMREALVLTRKYQGTWKEYLRQP